MSNTGLKILLVDDSSIILQRVYQLLNEGGLPIDEILIAVNGDEAILTAQTFQPHIMLLDISLPQKNGVEVLRHVRATNEHVKIIMLTSQPADQYKDLCMQLGANAFIDKTSEFETVPSVIMEIFNRE